MQCPNKFETTTNEGSPDLQSKGSELFLAVGGVSIATCYQVDGDQRVSRSLMALLLDLSGKTVCVPI